MTTLFNHFASFESKLVDLQVKLEDDIAKSKNKVASDFGSILCDLTNLLESMKQDVNDIRFRLRDEPDTVELAEETKQGI